MMGVKIAHKEMPTRASKTTMEQEQQQQQHIHPSVLMIAAAKETPRNPRTS